jgi:glycosyl transferase family 25
VDKGARLNPGQIGCAMSHLAIYRRMIEQDLDCALVFEDDVVLPADIHRILLAIAPTLRNGELIQLNNWKDGECLLSLASMSEIAGLSLYLPLNETDLGSSCAYLIDRRAAEKILQLNFPVRVPADCWEYFYKKGCLSTARVVFPFPVMVKAFESSILDPDQMRTDFQGRLVDTLRRTMFSPLRSLRRRWITRNRSREVRLIDEPSRLS